MTSIEYPLGDAPAPSLTVGRLCTLGAEVDRRDAEDVLAVLRVCLERGKRNGTEPVKLARETLDRWWEKRRRTNDPKTGQNVQSYPWSRGARCLLALSETGSPPPGQLVLDHLWPVGAVTARITAHLDQLDGTTLARCLMQELGYAVILKTEDEALSASGMRKTWLADPWDRYRSDQLSVGDREALDPDSFTAPRLADLQNL